ncbi:hypothetical protein GPECTOR_7g1032 [Gonium pectorale]|uniref:Guanylate cyclase domain-containing protein n=1 Tax=Gonium pectorale TaxID=33097 RepID=A0A150GTJ6_GONPE|nr:hypothetical protein GPECTOR_7g1032 [Gonium pectorale]|eukprot:KXZ53141.1 hypothetical protein GPECTOR_7g1032 [Gonium pectorale]
MNEPIRVEAGKPSHPLRRNLHASAVAAAAVAAVAAAAGQTQQSRQTGERRVDDVGVATKAAAAAMVEAGTPLEPLDAVSPPGLQLRETVLSGLASMVTALSMSGAEVLYQNAESVAYFGLRVGAAGLPMEGGGAAIPASALPSAAPPAGGLSELLLEYQQPVAPALSLCSPCGGRVSSGSNLMAQLFSLEPAKLDRLLADVCIEGRLWRGIVQVPASLEGGSASPATPLGTTEPLAGLPSEPSPGAVSRSHGRLVAAAGGLTGAAGNPQLSSTPHRASLASIAGAAAAAAAAAAAGRSTGGGGSAAALAARTGAATGGMLGAGGRGAAGPLNSNVETASCGSEAAPEGGAEPLSSAMSAAPLLSGAMSRLAPLSSIEPLATSTWGLIMAQPAPQSGALPSSRLFDAAAAASAARLHVVVGSAGATHADSGPNAAPGADTSHHHHRGGGGAGGAGAADTSNHRGGGGGGGVGAEQSGPLTGGSASLLSVSLPYLPAPRIPHEPSRRALASRPSLLRRRSVHNYICSTPSTASASHDDVSPPPVFSGDGGGAASAEPAASAAYAAAAMAGSPASAFALSSPGTGTSFGIGSGMGGGGGGGGAGGMVVRRAASRTDMGPLPGSPQASVARVVAFANSLRNAPNLAQIAANAAAADGAMITSGGGVSGGIVAAVEGVLSPQDSFSSTVTVARGASGIGAVLLGTRPEPPPDRQHSFPLEQRLRPGAQQVAPAAASISSGSHGVYGRSPAASPAAAAAVAAAGDAADVMGLALAPEGSDPRVAGGDRVNRKRSLSVGNFRQPPSALASATGERSRYGPPAEPRPQLPQLTSLADAEGGPTGPAGPAAAVPPAADHRTPHEPARVVAAAGGGGGLGHTCRRQPSDLCAEGSAPLSACGGEPARGYCWHEVSALRVLDPRSGQCVIVLTQTDVTAKVETERHIALVTEAQHRLLEQIFPRHVLAYMTEEGGPWNAPAGKGRGSVSGGRPMVRDINKLATSHDEVTLLFADIAGFTPMCKQLEPRVVMAFLNDLFTRFDSRLDEFGVYKVETIGDCYFVAGGLIQEDEGGMAAVRSRDSQSDPLHAERVFMFAKAMLAAAAQVTLPTTGGPVRMRIGIHSGPVVSGVVGQRMPRFCLFGDTVNTASRMESTGVPGAIHASEAAYALLRGEAWTPTGGIEVKGKGLMNTYLWAPPDEDVQTLIARRAVAPSYPGAGGGGGASTSAGAGQDHTTTRGAASRWAAPAARPTAETRERQALQRCSLLVSVDGSGTEASASAAAADAATPLLGSEGGAGGAPAAGERTTGRRTAMAPVLTESVADLASYLLTDVD